MKKESKVLLNAPTPKHLIQLKPAGKDKFGKEKEPLKYVSGGYVVRMLNLIFGTFNWTWHVEEKWIEEGQSNKEHKIAYVYGTLTVKDVDENNNVIATVVKEGYGSKISRSTQDQESMYKSASTDGLKKAASLLGVGLDLALTDDQNEYFFDLDYESPWTEETMAEFETELIFINDIKERYSADVLGQYIYAFSEQITSSENYITPENIKEFIDFIEQNRG